MKIIIDCYHIEPQRKSEKSTCLVVYFQQGIPFKVSPQIKIIVVDCSKETLSLNNVDRIFIY